MPSRGTLTGQKCVCANLIKCNKAKCQTLHLGRGSPKHKYKMGGEWIENSFEEKDSGLLVDKELNMSQQCALAAQKAKRVLGCTKRNAASGSWEVILPLCSALLISHLQCCIQFWDSHHGNTVNLLERVQRRAGAPVL